MSLYQKYLKKTSNRNAQFLLIKMATTLATNPFIVNDRYLNILCDPCRFNGKSNIAMKYCRDCNGHLCPNCVHTHMKINNTKNHAVSYIINKRAANTHAPGTAKIYKKFETKCLEHSKLVVSYCLVHDALCCRVCIGTTHRECGLQVLSEAAAASRDYRQLGLVEAGIKRLQWKFEEAQKEKQGNVKHLGHLNDTFTNAVKTYRKTLNNMMDKLETSILKRKARHYDGKIEELKGCLKTCQTAISALNSSMHKLDLATRQGDDQTLFLTIKKVQAVSQRYEKVYTDVEKLPKHYAFHFQPDIGIERFLKGVNELGKLKDETVLNGPHEAWKAKDRMSRRDSRQSVESDEKLKISKPSDSSAKKLKSQSKNTSTKDTQGPKTTDELNVRIQSDKKTCSITGTAYLPDDKLVIADATNRKIKLFGSDLKAISHLETVSAPRDITTVSTQEVAFTMPNDKSVTLISVGKEMSITKTIKLEMECYGIAFYENELFVTSGWSMEKEVQVLDLEGVVKRKLCPESGVLKCPLYVAVEPKFAHVFVSDYENGIIGLDMCGNLIFRYTDTMSKGYNGICSSLSGDVFVCSLQSNGVSKVQTDNILISCWSLASLNENELEPLISLPNKGGQKPRSIAYSKKTNKIAISFVGHNVDVISIYQL